jgi:CelD/BcsL family acetyltransferase involved in cellulose biosynthesis
MRSDLRRARRQAEKLGEVSAEVLAPQSAAEFVDLFGEAQRVEASSWKGRTKTALAEDAERRAFFSAYGRRAVAQGILRMAFLRIDGQAVATQIAVQSDGRLWLLKIGYDDAFSRCSPGQLLMLESLRYACDAGLKSLEFLGADAPWTRRWTKTERETISLAIYPATPRGIGALAGDFGPRVARVLVARGRYTATQIGAVARHRLSRRPAGSA